MNLLKINNKGALSELNRLDFIENDAYIVDDDSTIYLWFGQEINNKQKDKAIQKARELNKNRDGSAKLLSMQQNKEYGSFMAMMDELKKGVKEGDIPRRPEFKLEEKEKTDTEKHKIEEREKEKALTPIKKEKKEKQEELGVHKWLGQLQKYRTVKREKEEKQVKKKEATEDSITEVKTKKEAPKEPVKEDKEIEEGHKEEPEADFEEKVKTAAYFVSQKGYTYDELCYVLAEKIILEQPFGYASKEQIRKKAEEIFHSSTSYDELCWLIGEMNVLINTNFYNF